MFCVELVHGHPNKLPPNGGDEYTAVRAFMNSAWNPLYSDNVFTCGKNKWLYWLVQLKNSQLTAPCGFPGREESEANILFLSTGFLVA